MASSATSISGRVHAAVAAGESAEEVRRAIDDCAPRGWDGRRRAEAVNETGGEKKDETPLQAAHRLGLRDLVGLLLEEGADASKVLGWNGRPTTALAMCVFYDLPDTLRALLKAGHDANERLAGFWRYLPPASDKGSTLAHMCVGPPPVPLVNTPNPRLACLEALVHEGGLLVDARDEQGMTPLHRASREGGGRAAAAVDLLVSLGADVDARDKRGSTPIFFCAETGNLALLRLLLAHGASPDVAEDEGYTPLMRACRSTMSVDIKLELARRSSPVTRRAVVARPGQWDNGWSAVDFTVSWTPGMLSPLQKELIAELLVSGAPVHPKNTANVLPIAVSHGLPLAAQREAELVALRPAELCSTWRAHEAFVGLALDVKDLKAAQDEVEEKRRRLAELEEELGVGTTDSESESEDGEESGDDQSGSDEEEAGAAPSGSRGE